MGRSKRSTGLLGLVRGLVGLEQHVARAHEQRVLVLAGKVALAAVLAHGLVDLEPDPRAWQEEGEQEEEEEEQAIAPSQSQPAIA